MPEKVAVFDTTLRDGEQAAGTRLGSREKLMIARQLAQLRVDIIEAGYPNSSPEDFDAVQLLAEEIDGPVICALSRAVPVDIEACGKALARRSGPGFTRASALRISILRVSFATTATAGRSARRRSRSCRWQWTR